MRTAKTFTIEVTRKELNALEKFRVKEERRRKTREVRKITDLLWGRFLGFSSEERAKIIRNTIMYDVRDEPSIDAMLTFMRYLKEQAENGTFGHVKTEKDAFDILQSAM
jgi:hypothetical protein